ncbi:usg protein [Mesorhizobium sp. RP14(2022)]|uniref:Usg protein n=1 Tax=Mesorhizobium liriopis TaxID=2953882 RepID=A0ABT1C981_9HYPH|nr:usg protein [Mesorhizobium liriopis]MCO6051223.1 usg protein [Mesorhizobium liriopis]
MRRADKGPSRSETELMLEGYGLLTAEFFYHLPDHPHVLQTFLWQTYDLAPNFPKLFSFIEFWKSRLDGSLHSVRFSHNELIKPVEWRNVEGEFALH